MSIRTYLYKKILPIHTGKTYSWLINDIPSEEAAYIGGVVKTLREKLDTHLASISRLSAPIYPQDEHAARELLEELIEAKRKYSELQ